MLPYLVEAIKNDIVSRGSGFQNSKIRLEKLIKSELPKDRKISLMKSEYGIGGGTVTVALYDKGLQQHDSKGIKYTIYDDCEEEEVSFTWSQVLKLYEERGVV